MQTQPTVILSHTEINHKIRRIALQILETNIHEDEIILAGIANNGYIIAEQLQDVIASYSDISTTLCKVSIDKKNLLSPVEVSISSSEYSNKSVILVDDVLNSGATLIYAIKHFLDTPLIRLKTAVLVNRNHKKFPVKADFKGLSLSTSINEHVEVIFNQEETKAVLI
ncbi:phosphoribosyltransferase family protein [Pseudofulvibacter geojedonensis]|uniref:Phosphoribosyltransferase family protein n=1 Tax=Pseudofulvibacter geojedonensis TaxID=1123758 RepID=A0ABW3I2F5_9FLAO